MQVTEEELWPLGMHLKKVDGAQYCLQLVQSADGHRAKPANERRERKQTIRQSDETANPSMSRQHTNLRAISRAVSQETLSSEGSALVIFKAELEDRATRAGRGIEEIRQLNVAIVSANK